MVKQESYLGGNQLTSLPERLPASLKRLQADDNELASLPENLPASLTFLSAGNNSLSGLPANLPTGLEQLSVMGNNLRGTGNSQTALPYILERLSPNCMVNLLRNPLPDRMREYLRGQSGRNFPEISC